MDNFIFLLFIIIILFLIFTLCRFIRKTNFKPLRALEPFDDYAENSINRLMVGTILQAAGLIIPSVTLFVVMTMGFIGFITLTLIVLIPLSFFAGLISSINSLRYVNEKHESIVGILINAFFLLVTMTLILGIKM